MDLKDKMTFHVTGTTEKLKTTIQSKQHTIILDEPPAVGGGDKGSDPLSYLLASLAGCENIIAYMVAQEMNFDLQSMEMDVKGVLDPLGMRGEPGVQVFFEKVSFKAKVSTSESEERLAELKEKTDARCPVLTMMKAAGIELETEWVKA
ncbi:OsmC family protein [Domibacillus sp. DTU_2020_1001157_1_SI_ALB_TIR_016]|uniref:OsmC family protein n=1 Tax=Domibacillus sp. DTU_2020_1001157_1_SI_ALB_TIR_016 TaxID=3077789 RepID=UPI0028F14554|nr:OsmC family protein [Domibacillus sp. DTU_2020_1001157_1_SI_ALB_TIR_016]WNS80347.1 OsmC family protein [Domibacillus sp. DTU_2020_1001157_1_SI_ALB_TIR_016]